jgi:hypothetical protein
MEKDEKKIETLLKIFKLKKLNKIKIMKNLEGFFGGCLRLVLFFRW